MRKLMMTMMALLFAVTVATAQRGPAHRGNDLLSELNLTAEQQEQIKAIKQEGAAQMKELREQNPDQRPDREAMKKMREASQAKVEAVLTTEQKQQLEALKAERKAARDSVDKEALKAELKAHNETKVKPVIAASRAQFDQFISAEDKAALDRLRPIFESKPEGKAGKRGHRKAKEEKPSEADREARKSAMETWKTEHADDIAELKALTEKYSDDIKRVQESMKPQREQWAKEKREIMEKYLPEGAAKAKGKKAGARKGKGKEGAKAEGKGKGKRSGKQDARGDWPKGAAFLLMKG
ncbi:hypothetical protein FUA23_20360 [Neolewinella aurantiaca]|uniref:LTXXQ motif protein n=1 Tax=Neolewinella aurantiaca TaxID=2602767 RepID=A0A5C7F4Y8_9BACT|nr:Spy/CpxP family protein refolding chaperone [Neolewinella aurantiaca]TXF85652.1 hypothetical protein FUA23_20360 [Neolewinella aurantiaca]